ncbi:MAG: single-stranded DNA-binding protein [Bacteroidales bacterium]|nr:single-stranded DNA-binding protein [Bacteroidales bacterium]
MLNKVMLIGNVGVDPEVRYLENQTQNGVTPKVATFRMATSERFRDRAGEVRERTEWHNIVAWRQLADLCEKFIRKGTQIYVEGRLTTRSWDDQAGVKHYQTEIVADTIQLLGRRAENPAAGAPAPEAPASAYGAPAARPAYAAPAAPAYQAPAPAAAPAPAVDFVSAEPDDDLPF